MSDDYVVAKYSPTDFVVAGHNIPHLSQSLSTVDNSFRIYDENEKFDQEYFASVLALPIIIMVLGVLSVLIFQLVLCFRFCCKCCCSCCSTPQPAPNPEEKGIFCWKNTRHNPKIMAFFFICICGAVITDFCVYWGNESLSKGFSHGGNAMTLLAAIFTNIKTGGDSLQASGADMNTELNSADCSAMPASDRSDISSSVDDFVSTAAELSDMVGSFPSTITDAKDTFIGYEAKKDQVLFIYFAFIIFVLINFVLATCCRSKAFLNLWVVLTEIIVLTLTIMAGVEMVLVVLLGDFCFNTADSVLNVFQSGATKDILSYYVKCEGKSQFVEALQNVTTILTDVNSTINSLPSSYGAACKSSLAASIGDISSEVDSLITTVTCQPVYEVWNEAVNVSLCNYSYAGLFSVWLCHLLTAGFLFFILIAVSWFYEIYSLPKTSPTGEELEQEHEQRQQEHHQQQHQQQQQHHQHQHEGQHEHQYHPVNGEAEYVNSPRGEVPVAEATPVHADKGVQMVVVHSEDNNEYVM